jgi:hypothetical protein
MRSITSRSGDELDGLIRILTGRCIMKISARNALKGRTETAKPGDV